MADLQTNIIEFLTNALTSQTQAEIASVCGNSANVDSIGSLLKKLWNQARINREECADGHPRYYMSAPQKNLQAKEPAIAPANQVTGVAAPKLNSGIASSVLAVMHGRAPLSVDDLVPLLPDLSKTQIANNLYLMRSDGRVDRTMRGNVSLWSVPAEGSKPVGEAIIVAAPKAAATKKPAKTTGRNGEAPQPRDFLAAAESAQKTLKALEFSHSTAADALDVYLYSVADPVIYRALRDSEQSAKAALERFVAQGRM
jgi:hypothetical protein